MKRYFIRKTLICVENMDEKVPVVHISDVHIEKDIASSYEEVSEKEYKQLCQKFNKEIKKQWKKLKKTLK